MSYKKILSVIAMVAVFGLVAADVGLFPLSLYEGIMSFSAPFEVLIWGAGGAVDLTVYGVYNGALDPDFGSTEYAAIYVKPTNSPNAPWAQLCSWPGELVTGMNVSRVYECAPNVDRAGLYTLRASLHTSSREGCDQVTYTAEPFDGCGTVFDRTVRVIRLD